MSLSGQSQGAEVASDLLERYAPLGAHGQPVHQAFLQLRAAVRQRLGTRHANLFTRPVRDPHDKLIRWFAEVPGNPVHFYDLSPEEQTRLSLELLAMKGEFQTFIAELREAKGNSANGSHAFAAVLEQALVVPDDKHLYFIGDQPLATFWGFRGFDGAGTEVLGLGPRRLPAGAPPVAPLAAGPAVAPPARRWWWWLLLPLLLLLLLLGLRVCVPAPFVDLPLIGTSPGVDQRDPRNPVVLNGGTVVGSRGTVVGGGVGAADGVASGVGGADGKGKDPAGLDKTGKDQAGKDQAGKDGAAKDPAEKDQPQKDGSAKDDKKAQDDKKPQDEKKPQDDAKTPESAPKNALQIPPSAQNSGDVDFMKGNWKSNTGLYDAATKQPLNQSYRFGADGKGETVIRRPDGVECTAPAVAKMAGGGLVVEETSDPRCPDGRSYGRSKTRCTVTNGVTSCRGENGDGSSFKVGIEKSP